MRKLIVACMGLVVCIVANLATPQVAAAAKFTCDACEYGGDEFCSGDYPNDWTYCGAGATYCSGEGWYIDCVYAPEDFECADPCDVT